VQLASPEIGRVFNALGDPTRRAILDRLTLGPASVSHLAAPLGVTITAIGQHLQVLEETGFVRTEKLGRTRSCRLDLAGFQAVEQWAIDHRALWTQRMDRLGDLMAEDEDGDDEA
jgi:DNA-binding transcriptional ArsR family regulator